MNTIGTSEKVFIIRGRHVPIPNTTSSFRVKRFGLGPCLSLESLVDSDEDEQRESKMKE
jgi:hypothetical protein